MCEPTTLVALAGLGLSAAGTATQYIAGQNAASAAANAQNESMTSQNNAFNSRMEAQRQQLQQQTQLNTANNQAFDQQQTDQQAAQQSAMDRRKTALDSLNNQEQAVSTQAKTATQQGVDQATGPALQDAQTARVVQQQAMNAPIQSQITAGAPAGGGGSSSVVNDATEKALGGAARYVGNYGSTLAKLSSYNEPIETANNAATTIGTNLMPADAAERLIHSGAPSILNPSSVAYTNAGQYGAAVKTANAMSNASGKALIDTQEGDAEALANLRQGDEGAITQGKLNIAQANAAALAGTGQGLSSLGNLGVTYAGGQGAFSNIFNTAKAGLKTA